MIFIKSKFSPIIILIGVFFLCISCKENRIKPESGLKKPRIILKTTLEKSNKVDYQIDLMKVYKDQLFFFEFMMSEFHVYDKNNLDYLYGFGSYGDAPFEYKNVVKYEVEDSIIKTYDNQSSTIKKQVINTNDVLSLKKIPLDFISFSENKDSYLVSSRKNDDMRLAFNKIDKNFEESTTISIPEKYDFPFSALSYNGYFVENNNHKIYFAFETDHFLIFDNNLEFKGELPLIYNTQTPLFTKTTEGFEKDKNSKEVNIHAKIIEDKLYVLSAINTSNAYFIDVYDLEKLKYSFSYELTIKSYAQPREFVIEDDVIYVSSHEAIKNFKIKP